MKGQDNLIIIGIVISWLCVHTYMIWWFCVWYLLVSPPYSMKHGFSLSLELISPAVGSCDQPSGTRITESCYHIWIFLCGCWCSKLSPSWLQNRHSTNWAKSPALTPPKTLHLYKINARFSDFQVLVLSYLSYQTNSFLISVFKEWFCDRT